MLFPVQAFLLARGKQARGIMGSFDCLKQLVRPIDEVYRFMDETASSVIKAKAPLDHNTEKILLEIAKEAAQIFKWQ